MVTYRCRACGVRYLGPGERRHPCTACREPNEPAAYGADPHRTKLVAVLGKWLKEVPAERLQQQAAEQFRIVEALQKATVQTSLWMAQGFLRRDEEYLRAVDCAECARVIDELLNGPAAEQAQVLWSYPQWAERELLAARDLLLAH